MRYCNHTKQTNGAKDMKLPKNPDDNYGLERAIAGWIASGETLEVFPKKYKISLNSRPPVSYNEAYKIMKEVLERC